MIIEKSDVLAHITDHSGLTKEELQQDLSGPGFQVTLFHMAGLLRDLRDDGSVIREKRDGRQVYRAANPGLYPRGAA